MYEIIFYKDANGNDYIKEYLESLIKNSANKDNRIKLHKITEYMKILQQFGTRVGEPYCKHIENNIWELRPTTERIFFFYWVDNKFVMLHHFTKKTQKTPRREIDKAANNLKDFLERSGINGKTGKC